MAKKKGKSKTYVAIVLDKSGSMDIIRAEAMQSFNEQLLTVKSMQSKKMDVYVGLVEFGCFATLVKPVDVADKITALTLDGYVPNGLTAMYDGVMLAVTELEKAAADCQQADDVAFLVCIISDGMENNSKVSSVTLAEKLQTLQGGGKWTITYLGANQDLTKISDTLKIPKGNTCAFVASVDGMNTGSNAHNHSLASYACVRGAGGQSVSNFYSPDANPVNKK